MKYGILFLCLGGTLCLQAVVLNGWYSVLVWPGLSFGTVGAAYLGLGPGVFGKRQDGTMAWYAVAFLLPYLLLTWITWHTIRVISNEECCNEVVPGLFIGRRPLADELPEVVTLVVDLTSEFTEVAAVREKREYLAVPMLDTGIPSEAAFDCLVQKVVEWPGAVYIHCAQGHGRTGMVAAAVMVAKGDTATVEEAVAALRRVRPGVALGKQQCAYLRRLCPCDARTDGPAHTSHEPTPKPLRETSGPHTE